MLVLTLQLVRCALSWSQPLQFIPSSGCPAARASRAGPPLTAILAPAQRLQSIPYKWVPDRDHLKPGFFLTGSHAGIECSKPPEQVRSSWPCRRRPAL